MNKRKNSAYFLQKELHFTFNRKISAYFAFARFPVMEKTSNLDGSEVISRDVL
ncbi:hypothetical protein J2Z40_001649 [Cytobacillus eiseniae]|uniref:Transposase n=1 Tax=Cytobacillus eiseniae TaxID=762947 RepID=A0ABS4RDV6_9BACI|nr:hypothetical protein [Cytobacillus eiseniae]MBP2241087.1 hypothetical protein [Cytobacillus eiseniae]